MGSASSRMSASPALVHTAEIASDPSTASTSTTETISSSTTSELPEIVVDDPIIETRHVPTPPLPVFTLPSPIPHEGKGQAKEMKEDKEEGEITDDEDLPVSTKSMSPTASKRSAGVHIRSYDSYRPRHREETQGQHSQHQHRQPTHYAQPSPRQTHSMQQQQQQQSQHVQRQRHASPSIPTSPRAARTFRHQQSTPLPDALPIKEHKAGPELSSTASTSPPEGSLALPSTLTPEEEEQYIDIIRNLMQEGIKPDALTRRGATQKYVNMVCREFVERSRKKKTVPSAEEDREAVDTAVASDLESGARDNSSAKLLEDSRASSSTSAEIDVKGERIDSMEKPSRLIPTSSWTPAQPLPKSPVHIESYRPTRPTANQSGISSRLESDLASQAAGGPASSLPPSIAGGMPRPVSSYVPSGSANPLRDRTSELSPVVKRRPATELPGKSHSSVPDTPPLPVGEANAGPRPHIAPTPVVHGAGSIIASLDLDDPSPSPQAHPPVVSTISLASITVNTPAAPAKAPTAMVALLESKRRAMESMKRGRKTTNSDLTPQPQSRPLSPPVVSPPVDVVAPPLVASTQENLEDQVAALEKEVLGLREAEPMEVDEQEEGEIPEDPVPGSVAEPSTLPKMAPIAPSKTPVQLNKATKRPNAEDMMDNRSSTITARSLHPAKRRVFGAPLRMKRLLISLDDSDDDDDDQPSTPTAAELETERQRQLQEKEDSIMELREKILRLQAKAARDKKVKAKQASASGSVSPAIFSAVIEDAAADSDVDIPAIPRLATAALIAQEDGSKEQENAAGLQEMDGMDVDAPEGSEAAFMGTPQLSTSSTATSRDTQSTVSLFNSYRPILDRYPQLASSSKIKASLGRYDLPADKSSDSIEFDASKMSTIVLTRRMQRDPHAVICGAEAAGGSCADPTCTDLHLSRDLDRVHDEELIEYLSEAFDIRDTTVLGAALAEAKQVAGIGLTNDSPSSVSSSSSRKKKKKYAEPHSSLDSTPYSMSVAKQLVMNVDRVLQGAQLNSTRP